MYILLGCLADENACAWIYRPKTLAIVNENERFNDWKRKF
jgi:hypothetical protein